MTARDRINTEALLNNWKAVMHERFASVWQRDGEQVWMRYSSRDDSIETALLPGGACAGSVDDVVNVLRSRQ